MSGPRDAPDVAAERRAVAELTGRIARDTVAGRVAGWDAGGQPGCRPWAAVPASARVPFAQAGLLDAGHGVAVRAAVAGALAGVSLAAAVGICGLDPGEPDVVLAAALVSAGETSLALGMSYARGREAFGGPLARLPVVRYLLAAERASLTAAARLVTRALQGGDPVDVAAAPVAAVATAWRVVDAALQVHGGYGYTDDVSVSRWWREIAAVKAEFPDVAFDRLRACAGA